MITRMDIKGDSGRESFKLPCNNCVHADVYGYKEQMKDIKIECNHPFAKITIKCDKHRQDIQLMPKMV